MVYLLFLPACAITFLMQVLTKRFQLVKPNGLLGYIFYAFITGIFTAIFMFFANGMSYFFDPGIIFLSAFFAANCILGYYVDMQSLKYAGVLLTSIFGCWSLLPVVVLERIFGIRHHPLVILAVCGNIVAALLAAFSGKAEKQPITRKGIFFGLLKGIITTVSSLLSRLMLLFYGADRLLDYYGITNILICVYAVVILITLLIVKRKSTLETIREFRLSHVLIILAICLLNTAGSKLGAYLLGSIVYLPYVVLNGFFCSGAYMCASLVYHEKLTAMRLIAFIIQGISGVIAGIGQHNDP